MTHRIAARRATDAALPGIATDPAVVTAFLSDAAHVAGGFSAGVTFPRDEGEVAAAVARAARVLPVGAQSSLTGGATPRGEIVLSTRALGGVAIGPPAGGPLLVTAGAGVPLVDLQRALAAERLFYPPVPTFDGAFVGGTVSTNAAGPATFKYGATRDWVAGITVVLASGDVLDITRGEITASDAGVFEIASTRGGITAVPVPRYTMPRVAKLSAGYFAEPRMDLIDLFIGSEGTLGVITRATLRVLPRPARAVALIRCAGDAQAVAVTGALRREALAARSAGGPLDVAAIEFMDGRSVRAAGGTSSDSSGALLLVQIDIHGDGDAAFERLQETAAACGVTDDPAIAAPGDDRAAERLFRLREAVPSGVNALVAAAKAGDDHIEKTAGDMVVPFDRLAESLALYRRAFESRGLDYAIWGHVSDGNLHPNVIPRTYDDVRRGREALLEIARQVVAIGGAPLAEHGVGRSVLKQQMLRELYGEVGIEQMRAVKRALDPEWRLAPGVLFEIS